MAWRFDEVNDDVQITDNAILTLPDADWTLGGWLKLTDNVGTLFQYFLSWGAFSAANSLNWFIIEESAGAGTDDELRLVIEDGEETNIQLTGTSNPFLNNTDWTHLLLRRSGTTVTQYINAVADGAENSINFSAVNSASPLFFGSREDGNVDRFYGGYMAEWFKVDRALSANEITALANRANPSRVEGDNKWYCPMFSGDYTEYRNGLTVTNSGSIAADHPPLQPPFGFASGWQGAFTTPAAGGLSIPVAMNQYRRQYSNPWA